MNGRFGARAALALAALSALLIGAVAFPAVGASTSTTTSTQTQGGIPVSLALTVIPPKLPADGGTYPALVVSLEGATGLASLALNNTVVFLTSSEVGVGSITAQVTISRGNAFAVANFTTSTTAGTTSISATSVGLQAASIQVVTVIPSGFANRLAIIPVPGSQPVSSTGQGTILVETLDSAGLPAKASSSIVITLSSSDNRVVSLPSTTITAAGGSVLSSAPYDVGVSPGTATITGSASGFNAGAGTVTVQGTSPFALKVFAQPDPVATSTSGRLVVTLVDASGNPTAAPSTVSIAISSSNTTVVSPTQSATIPTGQIYAVASYNSGASPGTANLTASSPGLMSDFALVTVDKPVQPVKLSILDSPDPVLADNGTYASVVVALTDADGNPATASTGVSVTLTSSNSEVGSVSPALSIPTGSSYAVATFSSTFLAGTTTITALAQNLESTSATQVSYGPVPTKVSVQAVLSKLPADGGQYPALEVTLVDPSGLPAIAPVPVAVQLTSSNTAIATVNSTVVIGAGRSYALTDIATTISPGTANVTATSSGYTSSSTGFTTASPAPSQLGLYIAPASGIKSLGSGGDAIVAVQLQDSNSNPARARLDTPVVVTSANGTVLSKPIQLSILPGADYAWATVKTSQAGTAVLTASTSGLLSASATLSDEGVPVSVTMSVTPPVIAVGGSATVQLQVQAMGAPLQGANVTFTASLGSISPPEGVTDSAGQLTDTYVGLVNGAATVTASVQDPLTGNQTASSPILVTLAGGASTGGTTSKGLGILGTVLPLLVVVVVIAVVAVGVRRILKNREKGNEEFEDKVEET